MKLDYSFSSLFSPTRHIPLSLSLSVPHPSQFCLHPTFADARAVDLNRADARAHSGDAYLPGYVGLNNISRTDWLNATLQALVHVAPLRAFFLDETAYAPVRVCNPHS